MTPEFTRDDFYGVGAAWQVHCRRWERETVRELRADIPRLARLRADLAARQVEIIRMIEEDPYADR